MLTHHSKTLFLSGLQFRSLAPARHRFAPALAKLLGVKTKAHVLGFDEFLFISKVFL